MPNDPFISASKAQEKSFDKEFRVGSAKYDPQLRMTLEKEKSRLASTYFQRVKTEEEINDKDEVNSKDSRCTSINNITFNEPKQNRISANVDASIVEDTYTIRSSIDQVNILRSNSDNGKPQ